MKEALLIIDVQNDYFPGGTNELHMLNYRLMTIGDYEAAYDLWIKCGNGLNNKDDSYEGIEKYLKRNPSTSYVAVLDEKVVGVILCGHDGRRGIIQHACVSPDCRRMGIGKKLVDLAVKAVKEFIFLICCPDLTDVFQRLLNAV